jgi:uncharacterized membrane protein (DUF2068 family)
MAKKLQKNKISIFDSKIIYRIIGAIDIFSALAGVVALALLLKNGYQSIALIFIAFILYSIIAGIGLWNVNSWAIKLRIIGGTFFLFNEIVRNGLDGSGIYELVIITFMFLSMIYRRSH